MIISTFYILAGISLTLKIYSFSLQHKCNLKKTIILSQEELCSISIDHIRMFSQWEREKLTDTMI